MKKIMENTLENQYKWLQELEPGTRLVTHLGEFLTVQEYDLHRAVNLQTGALVLVEILASLEKLPRVYCCPSPFRESSK